jgi:hypothetical protein
MQKLSKLPLACSGYHSGNADWMLRIVSCGEVSIGFPVPNQE